MSNYKINLRIAEKWSDLPDTWKSVKKTQKAKIQYDLKDKKLISLFEPFFYDNATNIAMGGLYVNDRSLVASNYISIIHLINEGRNIADGLYLVSSKVAQKIKKPLGKLDEKFPKWESNISEKCEKVFGVDAVKLKTYCEAALKGNYTKKSVSAIRFSVNTGKNKEGYTLNANILIDALNVFLKLGNRDIYIGYNSEKKGIFLSPQYDVAKYPKKFINVANFILLMPLIEEEEDYFGAKNEDENTKLKVYYDFEDEQIHNADGTVAFFDSTLNSDYLPYISELELKMLQKIAGNDGYIPILENICVKDNVATAFEFSQSISLRGIFLEDGIYEIVSGAFKDTEYSVSDFPNDLEQKSFYLQGYVSGHELHKCLKEAINYISNDDEKPLLKGIGYITDSDGNLTINGTNAFILFTKKIETNKRLDISMTLKNPKYQEFMIGNMGGQVDISYTEDGSYSKNFFKFSSGSITYITEVEDKKAIKYKDVIPNTRNVLAFDKGRVLDELKKLEGDEAQNNIIFKFDKVIQGEDEVMGVVKVFTTKKLPSTYYNSEDKYEVDRQILRLQYDIFTYDQEDKNNVALIMPRPNDNDDEIEFNAKNLEVFLSTFQGTTNLYYNSDRINSVFVAHLIGGHISSTYSNPTPTPVSTPQFEVRIGDTFYEKQNPNQIYIVSDIKGDRVLVEWLKDNKQDDTLYDFDIINSEFKDGKYILKYRNVDREAFLRPTPNFKEGDKFKDVNGEIYLINQIPQNSNFNVEVIEKNSNDKIEFSIHNVNMLIDDGTWVLVEPNLSSIYQIQRGDTFIDSLFPQQEYIISLINYDDVLVEWVENNKLDNTIYGIDTLSKGFYEGRYVLQSRDINVDLYTRLEPNFEEGFRLKDENGGTYLIKKIPQFSNYSVKILNEQDNSIFELTIPEVNENLDKSFYQYIVPNIDVQVGDTFYHKDDPHKFYIISDIIDNTSISNNLVEVSWSSGKKPKTTNYNLSESISNFENGTWVLIRKGVDVDEFLEIKLNFAVGDKLRNTTTNEIVTVEFIPSAYDEWVRLKDENGASKYYGDKTQMLDWINDGLWVKEQPSLATRESIESIIRMYEIKAKRGDTAADSIIKMYQIKLKRL